jgi:hypothetical protein
MPREISIEENRVAYEFMKMAENEHSVLDAMRGIAGTLWPQFAGHYLER